MPVEQYIKRQKTLLVKPHQRAVEAYLKYIKTEARKRSELVKKRSKKRGLDLQLRKGRK